MSLTPTHSGRTKGLQISVCNPFFNRPSKRAERFYQQEPANGMMMAHDGAIKTFPRRGIKDSPPLRRVAPQKSALDVELERRIIPRAPDVDGEYGAGAIACEQRVDGFEEKPFHAGHRV